MNNSQSAYTHDPRPAWRTLRGTWFLILVGALIALAPGRITAWGGTAHRLISDAAVDNLPADMFDDGSGNAFNDHREFLSDHASHPDFIRSGSGRDSLEGPRHFCDMDKMDVEFGLFPFPFDTMTRDYNTYLIDFAPVGGRSNGVVQWEGVAEHYDALVQAFRMRNWHAVYRVAADLGHYIEDSTSPLHSAANFNGQLTNNFGIHSRHESQMVNRKITASDLTTRRTKPVPLATDIQFIFNRVEYGFEALIQGHALVDDIMAADDAASAIDGSFGTTYYNELFNRVGAETITQINDGAERLANLWYSAWLDADRPSFSLTPTTRSAPFIISDVDGNLNEFAGEAEIQTNTTDSADNANELDQLLISRSANDLLIGIAGNLAPGNAVTLLIDSKAGGSSTLSITAGPAYLRSLSGKMFATGFAPDFALSIDNTGSARTVHLVGLPGGSAQVLGASSASSFALAGGGMAGWDNSNIAGVRDRNNRVIGGAEFVRTGIEIALPFASLGINEPSLAQIKIVALITSNNSAGTVSNQLLPGFPVGEFPLNHVKIDTTLADIGWSQFSLASFKNAASPAWTIYE